MKTKTNQTTKTGTESEKWTSHGEISVESGKGGIEGEVQARRSVIDRHKIDRERSKMV